MLKQPPKFSVIIPNFNNGPTLARAIRSVQAQTYAAHEIIVVDDGSTDESARIVGEFGSEVIYLRQDNAGVAVARNRGVQHATGEWIAFLDADDEFTPDRLQAHADWIQDDPDLDFLLADQEARDVAGNSLGTFIGNCKAGQALLRKHPNASRIPLAEADFGELIGDGFMEIRTVSMPRHTFLELGGFPVGHKIGEDLHLFIRLLARSRKGGVVPRSLAVYYIYPTSALRKDPIRAAELFVSSLDTMGSELVNAAPAIRHGYRAKRHAVRLTLAYAYLRVDRKADAVKAIFASFLQFPHARSLKDVLSVMRGFPKSHPESIKRAQAAEERARDKSAGRQKRGAGSPDDLPQEKFIDPDSTVSKTM